MMCLDRNGQQTRSHEVMAPYSATSYIYSCFERCSSIIDSIWNPWSVGKSQKLNLTATRSVSDHYTEDRPSVEDDAKMFPEPMLSSILTKLAFDRKKNGQVHDGLTAHLAFSIIQDNVLSKPMNLMYHNFHNSGLIRPEYMSSTNMQKSNSVVDCIFPKMVSSAIHIAMTEYKLRTVPDSAPKALSCELVPQTCRTAPNKGSIPAVAVSVLHIGSSLAAVNQEFINRKNRELKKCSKKRRRRLKKQSKCEGSDIKNCVFKASGKVEQEASHLKQMNSQPKTKSVTSSANSKKQSSRCRTATVDVSILPDKKSGEPCANPMISFILGHTIDSDSECDSDFLNDSDFADIELCFTSTLSTVTVGIQSLVSGSDDRKNSRTDCSISILNLSDVSPEIIEANEKWNKFTAGVKLDQDRPVKVSFAKENELVQTFSAEEYDRKGEWERYALERCRFRRRINDLEHIISPVLMQHHRDKIFQNLQVPS